MCCKLSKTVHAGDHIDFFIKQNIRNAQSIHLRTPTEFFFLLPYYQLQHQCR